MRFTKLIIVLAFVCLAMPLLGAIGEDAQPETIGLKNTLAASEMLIGARPDGRGTFPKLRKQTTALMLNEFNAWELTIYPRESWAEPEKYGFARFNAWVNVCVENDLKIMVHMIAGPDVYFGPWFQELSPETIAQKWTRDEFEALFRNYIKALLTSNDNGEKVDVWNVVNEAFAHGGGGTYRDEVLLEYLGWEEDRSGLTGSARVNERHPAYISICFDEMSKHAKGQLELRDYDIEFDMNSGKYKAFYQLVKHLQNSDIQIDAVGLQGHLYRDIMTFSYDYTEFQKIVKSFKDLGLSVYVTELDINPWINAEYHGVRYAELFTECRKAGIDGVFFWGSVDGEEPAFDGVEGKLLFDNDYNRKQPQYDMVFEALNTPLDELK